MMREWIVTLYKREDLEAFYEDMETPGGNLYIPDRAIDVEHRREISRNTHYMLDDAEVDLIKQDERVWDVTLREFLESTIQPSGWATTNEKYHKTGWTHANWLSYTADPAQAYKNWGLLRHASGHQTDWGGEPSDTNNIIADLTVTASGKNVDIIVNDGHLDPNHPEFAVNADGTGGSRAKQIDWFQYGTHPGAGNTSQYQYSDNGSYTTAAYLAFNNHATMVGSVSAGNTQGWARDANIYNITPFAHVHGASIGSVFWDYIRQWHNTKPINPETHRRNPTICNCSWNASICPNSGSFGPVSAMNYRGTNFSPNRALTLPELAARGVPTKYFPWPVTVGNEHVYSYETNCNAHKFPNSTAVFNADLEDAIEDGIIITNSADNMSFKIVDDRDQDYNNTYTFAINGSPITINSHRGGGNPANFGSNSPIVVGSISCNVDEGHAWFSNIGNRVDIFAAGERPYYGNLSPEAGADPRNTNYHFANGSGTSQAAPQVAGVLACLTEIWPNMTMDQAKVWLDRFGDHNMMHDTGADDPNDRSSLQGAKNLILRWYNQRPTENAVFPTEQYSLRPTSGTVFPDGTTTGSVSTGVWPRPKNQTYGR